MYVLENLDQPGNGVAVGAYPDGTPKPIFIHHGPELSGIGTKLTAGRTPEQARGSGYSTGWKEPRHYSEYTIMPQLRPLRRSQQAMDLAEYLLSQKPLQRQSRRFMGSNVSFRPDDVTKMRDLVAACSSNESLQQQHRYRL